MRPASIFLIIQLSNSRDYKIPKLHRLYAACKYFFNYATVKLPNINSNNPLIWVRMWKAHIVYAIIRQDK